MEKQPTRHPNGHRATLDVFVSTHCWQCPEARTIAQEMEKEFVPLGVCVIDLDEPEAQKPVSVFVVPTFLLNGKVVSIGTPSRDALRLQIKDALSAESGLDEPR